MPSTARELQAVRAQEDRNVPFLIHRDNAGRMIITELSEPDDELTVGRDAAREIALTWDREVSRLHARLVRVGNEWVIHDDGLSRNGTYVNGERVTSSTRLRDRDLVRIGRVAIAYRDPAEPAGSETLTSVDAKAPALSPAERRVLVALARPWVAANGMAAPASNAEIADELFLSINTVKTHLRALISKFGLDAIPPSKKRAALLEAAYRSGALREG